MHTVLMHRHARVHESTSPSVPPPSTPHVSVYQPTLIQLPCMLLHVGFLVVDLYLPMHDDHLGRYTTYNT
jgi:hypothetical protein